MTITDQKQSKVVTIPEAVWGTTPASGAARLNNFTHITVNAEKENVEPGGIRSDLSVKSIIDVIQTSEIDTVFELSAGSHDDYLESVLSGTWSRPLSFDFFEGADVAWTGVSEITISDIDVSDYFYIGGIIKTEKFTVFANNGYFTVSGVSFASPDTLITVSSATSSIEAGNEFGIVMDADDVVIQSSNIRLGTAGAATIDSNGNNDFAAAIAAGELVVGQKIFVDLPIDVVAFDSQTITMTGPFTAGDSISVDDGVDLVYLFAGIDFAIGANLTAAATNLAAAINTNALAGRVACQATSAAGVVTIYYLGSTTGGSTELVDAGGVITVSSLVTATGASGRGFFTLSAVSDDVLTVAPTPPTEASPGAIIIKGSMLRNPGDGDAVVKRSFSQELVFGDIAESMLQDGLRVADFSTFAAVGEPIAGEMSLIGRKTTPQATPLLTNAPYDTLMAVKTSPIHSTSNIGDVYEDGVAITTAIRSIGVDIDANVSIHKAVGQYYPIDVAAGTMRVTGTMEAFFESVDMYNNFVNHTTISLSWYYEDTKTNTYYYTFPSVKITEELVELRGLTTEDVQAGISDDLTWTSFRDPDTGCLIQIDRFSSIKPV